MQCDRVIAFFFVAEMDSQEIKENMISMRRRYTNEGRHPRLKQYLEVLMKGDAASAEVETPVDGALGATAETGVYLYCHGGEGTLRPPGARQAELIIDFLTLRDKLEKGAELPVNKINLTACLGAGSSPKKSRVEKSHLAELCKRLKSGADDRGLTLRRGLAVCGWTKLMGTFDPEITLGQRKNLAPDLIDKAQLGERPIRTYMKAVGQTMNVPTHLRGGISQMEGPVDALIRECLLNVWQAQKKQNGRKYKEFVAAHPATAGYDDPVAFAEPVKGALMAFLDAYDREMQDEASKILSKTANPSARFVAAMVEYVRSKVVLVWDGRHFRSGSISDYSDRSELGKIADLAEVFVKSNENPGRFNIVI